MPIVENSDFRPSPWLKNCHAQTIFPALFRWPKISKPQRERIETPDSDFLDLDWWRSGNDRLVIISHGLEGSSESPYVRGMASALKAAGWDVLAWNMRGCSGEPNRKLSWYHSGKSEDLETVVQHAAHTYARISLIGFSIGGNITLKYLGERGKNARAQSAVAISVPCDLSTTAEILAYPKNSVYMRRFMNCFRQKVKLKAVHFPGQLPLKELPKLRTFYEYDSLLTAPLNGFPSAEKYWEHSSSLGYIKNITVPTLLLNAIDDPFLSQLCFPVEIAKNHGFLWLESPSHGGHVGFLNRGGIWSESRCVMFLDANNTDFA